MDMENLKNNFSWINTISLEQIGLVISSVSEDTNGRLGSLCDSRVL